MKNSKKKLIQQKELQDAKGLTRKKHKFNLNPKTFFIIKIVLIALVPIFYFVYSPLLFLIMLAWIGLFFLSNIAEKNMNKSFIKSRQIHISKFDSAIALIIIVISIVGVSMSGMNKVKEGSFAEMDQTTVHEFVMNDDMMGARQNNWWRSLVKKLTNLGSLLTGERSIFTSAHNFGLVAPPDDFVPPTDMDMSDMPEMPTRNTEFNIDDVPIQYMFSSILSSVNSFLIFLVPSIGAISLLVVYKNKKRMDKEENEVIFEDKLLILSDEEIDRILSFGEDVNK
ncbi:MAG: hypothetical protein AB7S44_01880 [Spirochaetales bacterium]